MISQAVFRHPEKGQREIVQQPSLIQVIALRAAVEVEGEAVALAVAFPNYASLPGSGIP